MHESHRNQSILFGSGAQQFEVSDVGLETFAEPQQVRSTMPVFSQPVSAVLSGNAPFMSDLLCPISGLVLFVSHVDLVLQQGLPELVIICLYLRRGVASVEGVPGAPRCDALRCSPSIIAH